MRLLFLADFFSDQINGGGENNDAVLISYLRNRGLTVDLQRTQTVTKEQIDLADFLIVGNFVLLDPQIKEYITHNATYIIYEHDHKYVKTRDPSKFQNFDVPQDQIVNAEFYKNAKEVIVLSAICKEILQKALRIDNVHSIGSSLWSTQKLAFIKELSTTTKTKEVAVLNSNNATKGTQAAASFCNKKGIEFELISSPDQYEFLKQLVQFKTLVFVPQVLETFCRLVAEAKMLNCNVYTNSRLIGMMSEPYHAEQGQELIETLEAQVTAALEHFYQRIVE